MAYGAVGAAEYSGRYVTTTFVPGAASDSSIAIGERVRDAISRRSALRVVGGGSWLDANRPVRADATLDVGEHKGIVEYEPGDLTLTARPGTTLDEIARATTANGQWLALDPYGDPARATLGATIATVSYGPLAHAFGSPRDMTLGVEFVSGTGALVRGGGRVVKNVAGFDLTRLVTGAWGTLGVITEATVRLRALPAVEATLAIEVGESTADVERVRVALRALPFIPMAAQLLDARAASAIGITVPASLFLVRLGGNEDSVRAQRGQLGAVGPCRDATSDCWRALRVAEPPRAAVLRLSRLPSQFATTWRDGRAIVQRWQDGYCHGDPGRGVVRVVLPLSSDASEASLRAVLSVSFDGTRVYERLPAALWPVLSREAMHGPIDRGIKAAFDPNHLLNPGIFGELQ
jgi:glycolate dehydrogenase FAD-binding subunit